jgi:hypothetical protein
MHSRNLWQLPLLAFTLLVSACHGNREDDRPTAARRAYPPLSEDQPVAAGARVDLRDQNYFAVQQGDTWTFDARQGETTTADALTRTVTNVQGDTFTVAETRDGATVERVFRRTPEGIVLTNPLPDAPERARRQIGDMLWYPEPFYAVGVVRTMVRQGNWGADIDNDGVTDSFRYVVEQRYLGLETVDTPRGAVQAARFDTVSRLILVSSRTLQVVSDRTSSEGTWFARGLGLVRISTTGPAAASTVTYSLTGGVVGGVSIVVPAVPGPAVPVPVVPTIDGSVRVLELTHHSVVYDVAARRYIASVPASGGDRANRLAFIDATSGVVTVTDVLGSDPGVMAIAPDGTHLFVVMRGTNELHKFALPSFERRSIAAIPLGNDGQPQVVESLSVSQSNGTVIAVALGQGSPLRHTGVWMAYTGVWQPLVSVGPRPSNVVGFDATSRQVIGYERGSGGMVGLSRSNAFDDGLIWNDVSMLDRAVNVRAIDVTPTGAWIGNTLVRVGDFGVVARAAASGGGCRAAIDVTRAVCLDGDASAPGAGRVAVVSGSDASTQATPFFARSGLTAQPFELLTGPANQVALRFGTGLHDDPATALWLFTSPQLP